MFDFHDLDETTRRFMLEAISDAEASGDIYYSARFNDAGYERWVALLRDAARGHDEHWLTYQLEAGGLMKGLEGAMTPSGGYTIKHVPDTAAETIAEGQFNRFYILGLCKRARAEGKTELEIYRAKDRGTPRSESQALLGTRVSVDEVEAQLRKTADSFRSPLVKPNSGISVRL